MQDLSDLPFGNEYDPPERVVCAANKYGDFVVAGVRHACGVMSEIVSTLNDRHCDVEEYFGEETQGFLTSKHRFVDRYEAWEIAVEQNQIVRRVGGNTINGGKLFSENLY